MRLPVGSWRLAVGGGVLPTANYQLRTLLHHHHRARIGLLESERRGALLDRAERGEAVDLQAQRLVRVLQLFFLLLQPRGLVAEADHGEVLPGEDDEEPADEQTEHCDREELAKPLAI